MKTCFGLAVVSASVLLGGCGKEQAAAPETSGGYVGALAKGQQTAVKTIDVTSLNQDIALFNAQEGRNPKDLNELVTQHYIGKLPEAPAGMKFVYDSTQGKVSLASE